MSDIKDRLEEVEGKTDKIDQIENDLRDLDDRIVKLENQANSITQ
jgi:hypothetical protein